MAIIFDVGAHDGSTNFNYTDDPNNTVYAFEPTPYLVENQLAQKTASRPNFIVVPKAVSDYCGKSTYTITGTDGKGCNSLLEFNEAEVLRETWVGHMVTEFPPLARTIEVEVITLESFIEEYDIERVDYLHCDAQGSDLQVLRGLGKYAEIVREGVVEVSAKNPIYKNCDNSWEGVERHLINSGFKITKTESNDWLHNELNIWFSRA
jgi:FkbM family methyltransferase